MFEVEITTGFSAAHRLRNYNGKCEQLHGHNYKVQVCARAPEVGKGGMVIDFGELKRAAAEVLDTLDHRYLNEIEPFDSTEPSAENIARHLFDEIARHLDAEGDNLYSVTVWESDGSRATYTKEAG